jgi:hypothetical protein
MHSTFKTYNVNDLIQMIAIGKLNPDPISQRPATSSGPKKGQEIIEALVSGLGVGMIAARDITDEPEMQKVYSGVKYLIIDGGHRCREFYAYYTNKLKVGGRFFRELTDHEQQVFLSIPVAFESIVCSSEEATKIFRARNKTTSVNFIEMVMCDDQSAICREVRSRTKRYKEYNNIVHPAFAITRNQNSEWKSDCFDMEINPRRKWDEYVFIAILKAIGKGNVDAGQREIEALVHSEYNGKNPVSKRVLAVVDRFFDDLLAFRSERGKKLNGDIFAAFQIVWFSLFEQNYDFKIEKNYNFMTSFMGAYTKLTGTSDTTYNNKIVDVGTGDESEMVVLKEYIRSNTKNYSNSHVQRICADFFLKEMGSLKDMGVVFREENRSVSSSKREELLAIQGYVCAIDGEPLTLENSVLGHDTPWAKGGRVADGAVIRKSHNVDMGSITIDEYRMVLASRKAKAA